MTDLLSSLYPWTKAFHIMAVISWMAGLFYLPRLFVYHVEQGHGREAVFEVMEEKLLRVIMKPAMFVTWGLGLLLVATPGIVDWDMAWPWVKAGGVIAMTVFHLWLDRRRKVLLCGDNRLTGRQFRMINEIPTILMVVIVLSVVLKF